MLVVALLASSLTTLSVCWATSSTGAVTPGTQAILTSFLRPGYPIMGGGKPGPSPRFAARVYEGREPPLFGSGRWPWKEGFGIEENVVIKRHRCDAIDVDTRHARICKGREPPHAFESARRPRKEGYWDRGKRDDSISPLRCSRGGRAMHLSPGVCWGRRRMLMPRPTSFFLSDKGLLISGPARYRRHQVHHPCFTV